MGGMGPHTDWDGALLVANYRYVGGDMTVLVRHCFKKVAFRKGGKRTKRNINVVSHATTARNGILGSLWGGRNTCTTKQGNRPPGEKQTVRSSDSDASREKKKKD